MRMKSEATVKEDQLEGADLYPALDRVVQIQLNIKNCKAETPENFNESF